jgi:hypothetical protein
MSERVDEFRRRAEQCEAAAARVSDPKVRTAYLDMAARWRKMAERQEAIDEFLSGLSKSLE